MKRVRGDDLLYRFFRDVLADHPEIFVRVPQMLVSAMGIWLPLDVYAELPVLLPWVVRDPKCRGSKAQGIPDAWSSPDENGYGHDHLNWPHFRPV